jgi:hypothetical protein
MKVLIAGLLLLLAGLGCAAGEPTAPFVHPGVLHTRADLDRMREGVAAGREPWKSGFDWMRQDGRSDARWRLRGPVAAVVCGRGQERGIVEMAEDGGAAYQNALAWCIAGSESNAAKSLEIIRAWSGTLREIRGEGRELRAALNAFRHINAAELMRHGHPGWTEGDTRATAEMIRMAILPAITNFAPFANGNWDAACVATLAAAGVYLDDRALFARAVAYYRGGEGNGRLTHYVVNEAGQCQESGRDQQHTQLGLGLLAQACEIAWNQGVDLYGEADHRLLKGFEYTARYNLGGDVPFVPHTDTTGKYRHRRISAEGRGQLRPVFEMVWNHYERRRGLAAPYSRQAAEKTRPEGAAFAGDHPGFGTLLFSRPADALLRNSQEK